MQQVVIDGASSDGSAEVARSYVDRVDSVVVSEPDGGIFDAMNKGLTLARGRFCLFLNSGDYLIDSLVVEDFRDFVSNNGLVHELVMGDIVNLGPTAPDHRAFLFSRHLLGLSMHRHPASFVPTDLAKAIGGYCLDYDSASDFDFMLRASFAVGVRQWSRTCAVFNGGGASSANVIRTPRLLARIRRDRLQPAPWMKPLLSAYDSAYAMKYRRNLRKCSQDAR